MSIQRYISSSFWEDEWVMGLEVKEKLLYLYFLTNPLTNIAGVYKMTLRRIVFDTGLPAKAVEAMIQRFSRDGKAYFRDEYIVLPAWPAHQRLDARQNLKTGVERILSTLSAEMLDFLGEVGYRYDTPKIPRKGGRTPVEPPKIPPSTGVEPPKNPRGTPVEPHYSDSDSDSDSDTDSDSDSDSRDPLSETARKRQVLAPLEGLRRQLGAAS